jgi:hypothetical protein
MAISGTNWRLANSLVTLRDQINTTYPNRNKASDGTIGDVAHQAQGEASDHNPNAAGVVTAMDITNDPGNGLDVQKLADNIAASRDARIKYMIFNDRIMIPSNASGWTWVFHYEGSHRQHLHVSVWGDYDKETKWNIGEQPVDKIASYEWLANASQFLLGRPTPVTRDWYNGSVEKNMTEAQVYASWANSDEARGFRFKAWDYDRLSRQSLLDANAKLADAQRTIAEREAAIKKLSDQLAQAAPSTTLPATTSEPIDTKQVNWLVRILINLFDKKK